MNRREASRKAKGLFMNYGWSIVEQFNDIQALYGWSDEERDLVFDYYNRCADRVEDYLGI